MSTKKNEIIKFTDTIGVPEEYKPVPASKIIPDWYKELESYMSGEKKTRRIWKHYGNNKKMHASF